MSDTRRQVLVDITIAAPIDTVWTALRDPAQIKDWFGWDSPSLAEEIKYIFADTATGDAASRVLAFDEWDGEGDAGLWDAASADGVPAVPADGATP